MNKNIFEDAKFGDRFKTRDGRMAVFIAQKDGAAIIIEGEEYIRSYYLSGKSVWKCSDFDIVSRWVESINEEELDKLALEYNDGSLPNDFDYRNGFKDGYRRAKDVGL